MDWIKFPWNEINEKMRDDFRHQVAMIALNHYRVAPDMLRMFAKKKLFDNLRVPGFRRGKVEVAPPGTLLPHVVNKMKQSSGVASIVIALWADARNERIEFARQMMASTQLRVAEDWSWQTALEGYFDILAMPEMEDLIIRLSNDLPQSDYDETALALFCLSSAFQSVSPESEADETTSDALADSAEIIEDEEDEIDHNGSMDLPISEPANDEIPPSGDNPMTAPDELRQDELVGDVQENTISAKEFSQIANRLVIVHKAATNSFKVLADVLVSAQTQAITAAYQELGERLIEWRQAESAVRGAAARFASTIQPELISRNDLVIDIGLLATSQEITAANVSEADRQAAEIEAKIAAYDKEKSQCWDEQETLMTAITKLRATLEEWTGEASDITNDVTLFERESSSLTLAEVIQQCESLKVVEGDLRRRRKGLLEAQIGRIVALVAALNKVDTPHESAVLGNLHLAELVPATLETLPVSDLKQIEQELMTSLTTLSHGNREAMQESADQLRMEWSVGAYLSLMDSLAQQNLDEDALLLLLAANMTNPSPSVIEFTDDVAASLIRGVLKFSDSIGLFNLVGLLSSTFYSGWRTQSIPANIKLCLLFLAAERRSTVPLVPGFLWNVASEWPDPEMIHWGQVWQGELLDNPVKIMSRSDEQEMREELVRLKEQARQAVEQEMGQFIRGKSLKSTRHRTLLNNVLMPRFAEAYAELEKLEARLDAESNPNRISKLVERLTELTNYWESSMSAKQIEYDYESARSADGINDFDPFHRRTTIHLLEETAGAMLSYGQVLDRYGHVRSETENAVFSEELYEELEQVFVPESSVFGWMEEYIKAPIRLEKARDEDQANAMITNHIVSALLSQASFAIRFPRLVGHLTEARLHWGRVLEFLLEDLAEPIESIEDVAKLLLDAEAGSQALLLASSISVTQQRQAQKQLDRFEREVADTARELEKLGGNSDDLSDDIRLGRWGLVRRDLMRRLEGVRAKHEEARRDSQSRARDLMRQINSLEEDLMFQPQNILPMRASQYIQDGLSEARRHVLDAGMTEPIEAFLEEVRYRSEHQSWDLSSLELAVERLRSAASKGESSARGDVPLDMVLELLETNELRQLGITPSEMVGSEIETRISLLRNWKAIHQINHFFSVDMSATERSAIGSFYQYFAQMVVLKYRKTPKGEPIVFEHPVVYSMYELKYPKTSALYYPCILLAVPGNPLKPASLREAEQMIEEKEWLQDSFVFLFIPGCTPQIHKRLTSRFAGKRLVILDESTLLSVMLAKTEGQTSLGRLRALMLNAIGAENVDVFQINQLVNQSTSLFVGRESLIQQITSSGDSFALYGGRRIGKSSVLAEIWERLKERPNTKVVFHSFEGDSTHDDDSIARVIARQIGLDDVVVNTDDLKFSLQNYLEVRPDLRLVILLDEIDKYIETNRDRHLIIEMMRSLSDRFQERFRTVVAGFMALHDCLKGRGPYTPTSDPWQRMINDNDPLPNLKPSQAEQIVREGFINILGWKFDSHTIPQWVVQRTGGHPAFVQYFCKKMQQRVGERGDQKISVDDVEAVFEDQDPEQSFVAYVRKTLTMNLTDPIGRFLILYLAAESKEARRFTFDQLQEYAGLSASPISEKDLRRNLEILEVTSVVKQSSTGVFEFTVPDYPLILNRLGETDHLDRLEKEIAKRLQQGDRNGN